MKRPLLPGTPGRPGNPAGSSSTRPGVEHLAIVTTLTLRTVFHLALRQAEGFVASLIRVMALDLETPDHTTLSRRSASVTVPPPVPAHAGPIHLVIDSTGLKIVGDSEWHVIKHKPANKHRCWRKLHLGVDAGGFIVASELTESGVDDGTVGVAIIRGYDGSIERFTGDGAYDTRAIYEALAAVGGVNVVIPPNSEAAPSRARDEVLRQRDGDRQHERLGAEAPPVTVAPHGRARRARPPRKSWPSAGEPAQNRG